MPGIVTNVLKKTVLGGFCGIFMSYEHWLSTFFCTISLSTKCSQALSCFQYELLLNGHPLK